MSAYRRRVAGRPGSVILLGVAAVLATVLVTSFLASGKALTDAEAGAESRAQDYVASVLSAELTPALVSSDVIGSDYRDLLVTIQSEILSQDLVVRLRIWKPGGDLIFSTAQRDRIEQYVAVDHPLIERAAQGMTVSAVTKASVPSKAGLEGSNERLYETFVPLRLEGTLAISGVVEIDQRYSTIQDEANRIWRLVQIALIVLLAGVAALFANSLRGPARAIGTPRAPRPSRDERRQREEEDRALVSEHAARQAGIGQRLAEAELRLRGAGNDEVPQDLRRHVEELQLKVRAERAERQKQDGQVQRLRAALAEKEAELALAREAAGTETTPGSDDLVMLGEPSDGDPDPRLAEANARAVEAERSAAKAERRAAAAAKRGEEADARIVELEAALRNAERSAADAVAGRDEEVKAAAELQKAQLLVKDLTLRLSEAEATNSQLVKAKAAGEAAKAEARKAKEQAAAATAEAEETRTDLVRSRAELEPLRDELGRIREELAQASADNARLKMEQEASGSEREASSTELELARAELEAARAEREAARVELERARAELGASAAGPSGDGNTDGRAAALEGRVAELEAQRRSEVGELQRAQESLANTQIELMEATRKLKAAEERVHALELGGQAARASEESREEGSARRREPEPEYTVASEEVVAETPTPHRVRDPRGAFASSAEPPMQEAIDGEDERDEASDKGLSLRERLSRAANARHRGPGSSG